MDGNGYGDLEHHVSRYLARAWRGSELVAETDAAVRVEPRGEAAQLWFPLGDVRQDLLETGDFEAAPAGIDWLAGTVRIDPERFRVELVDGPAGDPGTSVKRFPNWGDATDLAHVMDVRPLGDGLFESVARGSHLRSVVEGSQMLGQSVVAAGRHAPGRRAVSAYMQILRVADASRPLRFRLIDVSSGRTFTAVRVEVTQGDKLCAAGSLLLDVGAPSLVRHQDPPPKVPAPDETDSYDMGVTGRDVRMVDNAYNNDPDAPLGPPEIDTWVRYRELPDDPYLHAGLLAQFTGHVSIAAALRPHAGIGQAQSHRTISTAINAISLSLHADVRADEWMLYHHRSTFAGDGMTRSECRVYTEDGKLLASFSVDAMLRAMPASSTHDDKRAL